MYGLTHTYTHTHTYLGLPGCTCEFTGLSLKSGARSGCTCEFTGLSLKPGARSGCTCEITGLSLTASYFIHIYIHTYRARIRKIHARKASCGHTYIHTYMCAYMLTYLYYLASTCAHLYSMYTDTCMHAFSISLVRAASIGLCDPLAMSVQGL
jgi:hypothetical protein